MSSTSSHWPFGLRTKSHRPLLFQQRLAAAGAIDPGVLHFDQRFVVGIFVAKHLLMDDSPFARLGIVPKADAVDIVVRDPHRIVMAVRVRIARMAHPRQRAAAGTDERIEKRPVEVFARSSSERFRGHRASRSPHRPAAAAPASAARAWPRADRPGQPSRKQWQAERQTSLVIRGLLFLDSAAKKSPPSPLEYKRSWPKKLCGARGSCGASVVSVALQYLGAALQNSHPMTSAAKRIAELREQIHFHDRKYYDEARPAISDREYDRLMQELIDLEKAHPELVTPGFADAARGRRCADGAEARPARRADDEHRQHVQRGGSSRVRRAGAQGLGRRAAGRMSWSRKSTARRSACGMRTASWCWPRRAGAGNVGRRHHGQRPDDQVDSADAAQDGRSVAPPPILEVRGEVYMDNDDFQRVNKEIEAEGDEPYANPRNLDQRHAAAAGSEDRRQAPAAVSGPRLGPGRADAGRELLGMDEAAARVGLAAAEGSLAGREHRRSDRAAFTSSRKSARSCRT